MENKLHTLLLTAARCLKERTHKARPLHLTTSTSSGFVCSRKKNNCSGLYTLASQTPSLSIPSLYCYTARGRECLCLPYRLPHPPHLTTTTTTFPSPPLVLFCFCCTEIENLKFSPHPRWSLRQLFSNVPALTSSFRGDKQTAVSCVFAGKSVGVSREKQRVFQANRWQWRVFELHWCSAPMGLIKLLLISNTRTGDKETFLI